MKKCTITIVALLCFATIQAQQLIDKHFGFSGKNSVSLKIQIADSINLHTWNKNEVWVNASVNINDNKDNEAYITSFDETSGSLVLNARFKENYFKGRNNCCNETDIYWQVYIPENTSFNIETINANITIKGSTADMKVKTISGYIDLSVPSVREADLDFSTISGTIYTNHELVLSETHTGVPTRIKEKLNHGGAPMRLETISGDIYFRKSEQ